MTALALHADRVRALFPGLLASLVIAAAASFLSEHYGAPVMLFALLLGMAMNFLSNDGPQAAAALPPAGAGSPGQAGSTPAGVCKPGIEFTAKAVLRFGVALLGLRITLGQVADLGWQPLLIIVLGVVLTIAVSMAAARLMGFQSLFGLLSGGATAICGASAALALAAALPNHPQKERATLFTVVGVSALSTLTMIVYPMIARAAGLDDPAAGVFLGATIHDVAQVVGAGYGMSQQTGDVATLVKLLRVAMLVPVIVFAVMLTRTRSAAEPGGQRPPLLPGFAVGFVVLMLANSSGWLPKVLVQGGSELSRWCLVAAIAAIGMKTQLKEVATVGLKPVLLMLGETAFLALLALALLRWL